MSAGTVTGVVTILVTDQVGSTESRDHLGDDAADRALRVHTLLLREAVAAAHGEEVKHLGDGIMASFGSPSAAIGCAVAIQQAVHRQNRRSGEAPTEVRVGLDVGEASTEDGDWFGTAVVVATRLCQLAGAGQILASELLRRLVGSRGGFDFGPVVARQLKGMSEPVPACEVRWALPAATAIAMPPELAASGPATFIGRTPELERLTALWNQARLGRPGLAVLTGEPGIGKTRLGQELAAAVAAEGATVLIGRCEEDSLSSYQPLVEPLRYYVLSCPADHLAADLAAIAPELASLVPEILGRVAAVALPAGPVDRYRVFAAAATVVRAAAGRAPVLLLLDDLQWAEKPALMLLRHLVRHLGSAPVLVVATCRQAELATVAALGDLVAGLRRDRLVEVIPVGGLGEREVASLVHELGGRRSPPGFVRAVFTATEGNPLFVESLVRHFDDAPATAGVGGLGLPDDVTEMIARRLARLSPPCQRVLSVASVLGREFDAPLLGEIAEVGDEDLIGLVEEAVASRVLVEVPATAGRYAFHHAVIRQVLYEGLIGLRRARLHRRIGAALEGDGRPRSADRLASLAHHFLEAARGAGDGDSGTGAAVDYAYAAASGAMGSVAFEEAAGLCERALHVLERQTHPDADQRLDVLLLLGQAHCRAGDTEQARKAFGLAIEAAGAVGTPDALSRSALTYAEVPAESGVVDERLVAILESASASLGPDDPRRARLLARLVEELYFTDRRGECRALSDEAVSLARRTADPVGLVDALDVRRLLLVGPGAPTARLAVSEELVAVAEGAQDVVAALRGRVARVVDLVESSLFRGIDAEIDAVARLADQARQPAWAWYPAKWRAMRALMAGRIDDAERLAQAALAVGERPHGKTAFQAYVVQLVEVRRCQGRLAELEESMATGAREYRATAAWRCGLAWVLADVGRTEQARRALDAMAADHFAALPDDFTWLTCATALADVSVRLADIDRSAQLYDLLLPYAEQCMFAGQAEMFGGWVARYLGALATTLGRWPDAERFLLAGLWRSREAELGPETARTEVALARLYRARGRAGDAVRADASAARAAAQAHQLGLHALAREALTR